MNRTTKIILVIVAIVAIVFGIARYFSLSGILTVRAPSSSLSSPSTSVKQIAPSSQSLAAAAEIVTSTQIIQYEPPQPAKWMSVEKGSCWTNSIAAPFRGDAWRCSIGKNIIDPCFQISGKPTLLCGVKPANPAATTTFVLQLTKPLPKSNPVEGLQPSDQVWALKLQGGTFCSPFTGTLPFTATGEAAAYGCAPGPLGQDVMIFDINSSSTIWRAHIGTLSVSTSSLPTIENSSMVPIANVWR